MNAMEISRSGLDVEWQRLQVIAQNLANINTSRTSTGEPFRPMRLVSGPKADFSQLLSADTKSVPSGGLRGVAVTGIEAMPGKVRRVYEPGHPNADPNGFVTYPDVDVASEMTLMIQASRSYEANLVAMNIGHQMYSRALELGRSS
jgi:flagellar basal-body rod protein FlgC